VNRRDPRNPGTTAQVIKVPEEPNRTVPGIRPGCPSALAFLGRRMHPALQGPDQPSSSASVAAWLFAIFPTSSSTWILFPATGKKCGRKYQRGPIRSGPGCFLFRPFSRSLLSRLSGLSPTLWLVADRRVMLVAPLSALPINPQLFNGSPKFWQRYAQQHALAGDCFLRFLDRLFGPACPPS